MAARSAFGSSALARSTVAMICSPRAARSTGAIRRAAGLACPGRGVAEESKVRGRRIWTRRSSSSHPGDHTQAVPTGRDDRLAFTSFAWSSSACSRTHSSMACTSRGPVIRSAMSTSAWVRMSLFSVAGRCVTRVTPRPADPTAADKVRHGAEQSFAAGQDALRGEQVGLVDFTDRARWLPGPDKRFRVAHM